MKMIEEARAGRRLDTLRVPQWKEHRERGKTAKTWTELNKRTRSTKNSLGSSSGSAAPSNQFTPQVRIFIQGTYMSLVSDDIYIEHTMKFIVRYVNVYTLQYICWFLSEQNTTPRKNILVQGSVQGSSQGRRRVCFTGKKRKGFFSLLSYQIRYGTPAAHIESRYVDVACLISYTLNFYARQTNKSITCLSPAFLNFPPFCLFCMF